MLFKICTLAVPIPNVKHGGNTYDVHNMVGMERSHQPIGQWILDVPVNISQE